MCLFYAWSKQKWGISEKLRLEGIARSNPAPFLPAAQSTLEQRSGLENKWPVTTSDH